MDLTPGDGIVLYTDGVSDPGPGPQRLPVEALRGQSPGADAETLAGALEAYALREPVLPRDDIAIIAFRLGEQPSADAPPSTANTKPQARK